MILEGIVTLILSIVVIIKPALSYFYFFAKKRCSETEKKTRRLKELNLKVQVIKKQELKIGTVIGAGQFGTVKIGKWNQLKEKEKVVAVKFLECSSDSTQFKSMILKEIYIFDKLRHENIIQFLAVYGIENYYCLVMEYFEGTNIKEIEYKSIIGNRIQILLAKDSISHQICKALTYLHINKICHGDIANPNNTLVSSEFQVKVGDIANPSNTLVSSEIQVKVVDFGRSEFLLEENSNDKNEKEHGTNKIEFNNIVNSEKKNTVQMLIRLYTEFDGQYSYSSGMNRNHECEDEIEKACFDKVSKNLSSIFDHYLSDRKLD